MRASLPLIFIHGSGDSHTTWDALRGMLPGVNTLALDLPGHGARAEESVPQSLSVADFAADVREQLGAQGIERCVVVGHSLGSAVALRLAADHRELVRGVVLIGSGARLRVLPALLEAVRQDQTGAMTRLAGFGFAQGNEAAARGFVERLLPMGPGALHRDLAACDAFDMMAELPGVATPALVITGEEDKLTPAKYGAYLGEHLQNATVLTISGAGHYVHLEAAEHVAKAILDWLPQVN